jgi:hypothetical protein
MIPPEKSWNQNRDFETYANQQWDQTVDGATLSSYAVNELRLFTTINNPTLRGEFVENSRSGFPKTRRTDARQTGRRPRLLSLRTEMSP